MIVMSLFELTSSTTPTDRLVYLIYDVLCFIPRIPDSFSFFPSFLHSLFENEPYYLRLIGKIYLIITKLDKEESLVPIICELIQEAFPLVQQHKTAILFLCQSLFINLAKLHVVPSCVSPLLECIPVDCPPQSISDIIATIALVDPVTVFSDRINVNILIELTHPFPFLAACQVIFSNWYSMPDTLTSREIDLRNKITESLKNIENETSDDLYDKDELISFFST